MNLSHSLRCCSSLNFFLFGSYWQRNKCYAKTIFPTHQTNIPLRPVINALAFLFKAKLCVSVVYACMYRINPFKPPQIGYHICISKLTYHSNTSIACQATTTTPYEYKFSIFLTFIGIYGLRISFFLFSRLELIFLLNAFPHAILSRSLFSIFCGFEHWIRTIHIFKSSTVIISLPYACFIGNLTKICWKKHINVTHGYRRRFGCFHRLSIPKSRH